MIVYSREKHTSLPLKSHCFIAWVSLSYDETLIESVARSFCLVVSREDEIGLVGANTLFRITMLWIS